MSAAPRPRYTCPCGYASDRWSARCPECGGWIASGSSAPKTAPPTRETRPERNAVASNHEAPSLAIVPTLQREPSDGSPGRSSDSGSEALSPSELVSIADVDLSGEDPRFISGIEPIDRVLGGGFVPGCSYLISGDPGAGKSTLLSQILFHARRPDGEPCERLMWASAEETVKQIALRAQRIGARHPKIRVTRETNVDRILVHASQFPSEILVVDSIQTISTDDLESIPGSVQQVQACATRLDHFAKDTETVVVLICQVNKDGQSAGPNKLNHLVDALVSLRVDDEYPALRYFESSKNRFGSTLEVGHLEMSAQGLRPILPPATKQDADAAADEWLPIAQELVYRLLETGGDIDAGLRDRIGGRLDVSPRGSR